MPYFSRLTDIVTCNLTSILARSDDPRGALGEMIVEMQEGVAGADRSVRTAITNVSRIESEIGEQQVEVSRWIDRARNALQQGDEEQARHALERKNEVEDLIAGLEQQLQAAITTRDHLQTMFNALEARLADARRRLAELSQGGAAAGGVAATASVSAAPVPSARQTRVEAELEALKQQLKGAGR